MTGLILVVLAMAVFGVVAVVGRFRRECRAIDDRIAAFNVEYPRDWDIRELVPDNDLREGGR